MFCPNCGTQLDDDAAFCTNCGVSIPGDDAPGVTADETLSGEDNVSRLEAVSGQKPEPEKAEALPTEEPEDITPPPVGDIDTRGIQPKKSYKKLIIAIVFIVLILCSIACCCALMMAMPALTGYGY